MMGEIKEYEEAHVIFDLVYVGFHGGRRPHHSLFDNFMSNLKGENWKIAIVGNWSYTNPDDIKYAQVIWQGGE